MSCEEKIDEALGVLHWIREQVQIRQDEQKIIITMQKLILDNQEALKSAIENACSIREKVRALRDGVKNS